MKKVIIALLVLVFAIPALAKGSGRHSGGHSGSSHRVHKSATGSGAKSQREHVSGYARKDGKQVKGHDRSTKDGTKNNNWSTRGNRNPDTGKPGSKKGGGQ
jgi:hypothetical protein